MLAPMKQSVSPITLGVSDYEPGTAFYKAIGWSPAMDVEETAFFQANGVVLVPKTRAPQRLLHVVDLVTSTGTINPLVWRRSGARYAHRAASRRSRRARTSHGASVVPSHGPFIRLIPGRDDRT